MRPASVRMVMVMLMSMTVIMIMRMEMHRTIGVGVLMHVLVLVVMFMLMSVTVIMVMRMGMHRTIGVRVLMRVLVHGVTRLSYRYGVIWLRASTGITHFVLSRQSLTRSDFTRISSPRRMSQLVLPQEGQGVKKSSISNSAPQRLQLPRPCTR